MIPSDEEPTLYPEAIWRPLFDHSAPGRLEQRDLIVLHITEGPTAEGAIATFEASVHPKRVSAHFVVDRDGTIYQLLSISDTAWHASQVNSRSIGIEHAAIAGKLMVTDAQYQESSKLIAWLCKQMLIPCDREHVQGHNECSPKDGHVLCCTGALNIDRMVGMSLAAR